MSDKNPYIPRFSIEISEEMKARADNLLNTHGVRKAVMTPIINDLLNMIEEHGNLVVGVIMDGSARPRDIIKCMKSAEDKANG